MTAPIFVSGASGFIGRNTVAALSAVGYPVIALGRDERRLASLPNAAGRWSWERLHSLAADEIRRCAGGLLFHLAGLADRHQLIGDGPAVALQHAREMAKFATLAELRGVVLVSSIYASIEEQGSRSDYGRHKLAVEHVFRSRQEFPTITLRLPPVYGRDARGGIPLLAKLVRRGIPLPLGLASQPRDYLAIGNLSQLFEALAKADRTAWERLNGMTAEPSDGVPLQTSELVRLIGQVIGRRPILLPIPASVVSALVWATGKADLAETAFRPLRTRTDDILARHLGWKPELQAPASLSFLRDLA